MSARYARVYRDVWRNAEFRALEVLPQWLYLALITQPDLSTCGHLVVSERRWSKLAAGLTPSAVIGALDDLVRAEFVLMDDATDEVLIRTYIRHDGLWKQTQGPRSIELSIQQLMSESLADAASAELDRCRAAGDAKHQVDDIESTLDPTVETRPESSLEPHQQPTTESREPRSFSRSSISELTQEGPVDKSGWRRLPANAQCALKAWARHRGARSPERWLTSAFKRQDPEFDALEEHLAANPDASVRDLLTGPLGVDRFEVGALLEGGA